MGLPPSGQFLAGENDDEPADGVYLERDNSFFTQSHMAVCQNLVPLVHIKIAGKWIFIPLKMVLIGIDPYPHGR